MALYSWFRRPLALLGAMTLLASAAAADAPDPEAIIKSLLPKPKAPIYRSLFNRGIEVEADAAPEPAPEVNLTVNYAFDSAALTNDGALTLSALGKALRDPRLEGLRFRVIGHTDAKGTQSYNLTLSRQRADTVGAFLYQFYQIDRSRVELSGKGSTELRDPAHPEDGINRRVQVLTILPAAARVTPQKPSADTIPPDLAPPPPKMRTAFDDLPKRPESDIPDLPSRTIPVEETDNGGVRTIPLIDADTDAIVARLSNVTGQQLIAIAKSAMRASGLDAMPRLKSRDEETVTWILAETRRRLENSGAIERLESDAAEAIVNAAAQNVREQTMTIDMAVALAEEGAHWSAVYRDLPIAQSHPSLSGDFGGALLTRLRLAPNSILSSAEARIELGPMKARQIYAMRRELLKCLSYTLSGASDLGEPGAAPQNIVDGTDLPPAILVEGSASCAPRLERVLRQGQPSPRMPAGGSSLVQADPPREPAAVGTMTRSMKRLPQQ